MAVRLAGRRPAAADDLHRRHHLHLARRPPPRPAVLLLHLRTAGQQRRQQNIYLNRFTSGNARRLRTLSPKRPKLCRVGPLGR